MRLILLSALILAFALVACAQTDNTATPLREILTDPTNITLVSYALAQVADSTTDWQFTLHGKQYNVSPAQRTAFAGATLFGAVAVAHYLPKTRPWVTAGLVIGTAILAGRAYGHTLNRSSPAAPVALAIRLH